MHSLMLALTSVGCILTLVLHSAGQDFTNSELMNDPVLSNNVMQAKAVAEYRRHHPNLEEMGMLIYAMSLWKGPTPLPKSVKSKIIIARCVEQLHTAFDTNQITLACEKLTNRPASVIVIKTLSEETISNLNFFATLLTSPDYGKITGGDNGWSAELYNSNYYSSVSFWISNGVPSVVRDMDLRTPDAQRVILSARFYENGKLWEFDKKQRPWTILSFKPDGSLDLSYAQKP